MKILNDKILKHTLYNFIVFFFLTIILFLIFCFLYIFGYLIKRRNYYIFISLLVSISFFIYKIIIYKSNSFSCDNLAKGLNNSYIDNISKDYPCKIDISKSPSCYISEIYQYFTFNKLYIHKCSEPGLMNYEKNKFLKEMSNQKYVLKNKKFEKKLNEKIILLDLFNKNQSKYYSNMDIPEIKVILTRNGGKIEIKMQKNTSLINEREEKLKKNNFKELYKNVLILFIDSLSRVYFHKKFKKTKNFLEKYSQYKPNPSKNNITVFQFLKYQSIDSFTDSNIKIAYYGTRLRGKGKHFANFFKNSGYIIGRVNAFCEKEIVYNKKNPSILEPIIWDHDGLSLGCIKSIYDRFTFLINKCLFGNNLNQYALEYLESFWTTYINQNKLFLFQTLNKHELTGELIESLDEILYNFLNKFNKLGYFKDTAIIIFSDHEKQLNEPLYLMDNQYFGFERHLPTLFLIVSNDKKLYNNNFFEIIKSNQQTFITPFDIYNTLINLSSGRNKEEYKKNSVSYGGSFFHELNYKKRYCESSIYEEINISKNICICQKKV